MTELLKENDYLKTSDMALVTALNCKGYPVETIEKLGSKAYFFIKRDEELDILIQRFWAGQMQVEPMAYFNSLKMIKTRIYNTNN